jgi:hypothetical protein
VSTDRAKEIMEAVADHVVASFEEIIEAIDARVSVIGEVQR